MKSPALLAMVRSLLMYYAIPGRAAGWRKLYGSFVSSGDLCFDLGAHVGNRSAAMLALHAWVVAVEPLPDYAQILRRFYGRNPRFALVNAAVGRQPGHGRLLVSTRTPTVSTLSPEWVTEISTSPGFADVAWDAQLEIEVTTLDELISAHGLPAFCKIDVEGSELDVLLGLSQSIPALSYEYIPAAIERALQCMQRLGQLAAYRFNLVEGEKPHFTFADWVEPSTLAARLEGFPRTARAGEVFARI
jgi:FkbM family methyltransferase